LKLSLRFWVSAWLRDFLEWIEEDQIRIEFLKQDIPETLNKLRQALSGGR
jgi:hypothetical protein